MNISRMIRLDKAVNDTRSGKTPGQDGIPSDVLKTELLDLFNSVLAGKANVSLRTLKTQ